ncbi:MAG: hypothetical protein NC311_08210 [Muribaculaceae bacterium]|nr:hypothetical protein [Muribaculaceae bacterium]MCM1439317.1 hypothetical protein [Roseburia sp.]
MDNIKDLLTVGGVAVFALSALVEIAPIKVNPWSWIARLVGRAINADTARELAEIKKKLDDHVTKDDRRTADGHRAAILRFNNELLREIDHTKEEFVDALAEIDAYERFCEEHPEYPNSRAVLAIENIRENYKERLKKHDFLCEGGTGCEHR